MYQTVRLFAAAVALTALAAFAVATGTGAQPASPGFVMAQAGGTGVSEKEAFEAAKELGTIEAWEAFLNNFPTGFRADLARAYVRRLGSGDKTGDKAAAPAPQPTAPAPHPAAAPPPPAPPLPPVDMGPGTTPWRIGTYELDEGRTRTTAAIVEARGVQLSAYCTAQRTVPFLISDKRDGIFPDFDQRVEQGLRAAGGDASNGSAGNIPIVFQNGQQVFVRAAVQGLTGELVLGDTADGFNAGNPILEQMMAANSMTVSMPPFGATFQLTNSRNAICALLRSCGAANAQPGCAAPAPPPTPVVTTPSAPRPQTVNCTLGRVFSSGQGKCVCPRNEPFFFGGRCRASRDCPGDSALNSRGQCVKENEPPRQRPQQVDTCPGDSSRNAQGICVKDNEPPPQQNNAQKFQCGVLQVACAAGNKNACNNMASACR